VGIERKNEMTYQNSQANSMSDKKPRKENKKAPLLLVPIFKIPIILYQLRLGWMLGNRFMQITHVGRRSGKVRRTILAVLKFNDKTNEIYAVSAWKGSDWFYNIHSSPVLDVETGFIRYIPEYRDLSAEEISSTFVEYRNKHPFFCRMICRIPGWKWDSTYEEFLELARDLHGVVFKPKNTK
jgi:deazaflavin-dependent oxidoreductase (nitroreductase family)